MRKPTKEPSRVKTKYAESDRLPYGIVEITGGRYRGRVGFYDNDEGGVPGEPPCAVVYFAFPGITDCRFIPHRYLKRATAKNEAAWHRWNTDEAALGRFRPPSGSHDRKPPPGSKGK